ncbi:hypothetical protein L9F63_013476, partial [Diploptera punctata]
MNIYEYIYPIIFLSRLIGLTPFMFLQDLETDSKKCKLSNKWMIYSIIFILGAFASLFTFICVIIIEILTLFYSTKVVLLINDLSELYSTFVNRQYTRKCRKYTSYSSLFVLTMFPVMIIIFMNNYVHFAHAQLFLTVAVVMDFLVILLPYFQFVHFLILLKDGFIMVNAKIESLLNNLNKNSGKFSRHTQSNVSNTDRSVYLSVSIHTLSKVHNTLCEITENLSHLYFMNILATVGFIFIQTTFSVYTFLQLFLIYGIKVIMIFEINSFIIWIAMFFIILIILLWFCSITSFELELFSLQLLHRKVEFTVCGLFKLDFTLLYSVS